MLRVVLVIAGVLLAPPAAFFGSLAFGGLGHGYGWSEMDWNGDGWTSFGEVVDAADIGKRQAVVCQRTCTEYFAYKDGMPVRTDCPPP
ncbi:hypothetical protein SGCZBJ_12875 [Caulobacter zeae]|uniref:Uncharacterized protein n=1 Tax=Caulobacter zeae TaxID=2055137 RepID=A0A2N5DGF9_9CAUL|nr:hypothetical protein [Caulobacter zeae]PLR25121.1 hypothetical protein SGCZBJ_12875 [Caulobacter zeae]